MMTNSDLTLFNKIQGGKYLRTYFRGVNWQDEKAITISKSDGIKSSDGSSVFIPLNVDSDGKEYRKPKTFKRLDDRSKFYTLDNGDIVVKGIIDFELKENKGSNLKALQGLYDDVMVITKVDDNRYGSKEIQHFELEVK